MGLDESIASIYSINFSAGESLGLVCLYHTLAVFPRHDPVNMHAHSEVLL